MGDASAATECRGLFKRNCKGTTLPAVTVRIERGRIQFFAQVVGETNPIHLDVEAARAAGHPDVVAPAAFYTVVDAMANDERRRMKHLPVMDLIGCDLRYLLHGDETYEYSGAICAGDEISVETRVVDFYERRGGAMEFVTLRSVLSHRERGALLTATRTLLHRLG